MPHQDIFAFKREKDDNQVLVLLNLSGKMQKIVPDIEFSGVNVLTGYETVLSKGKEFEFAPWQAFVITPK